MTPYDPSMTISDYISQLEKHIQIMQHLVQAMKLAEQMARLHGQVKPAMYPQHNSWQQWTSPGFQQPNVYQGYGAPYSACPTERGDAFRFFDHHKDALAPIQDMFNRSMTGGFADMFGPRAETNSKTNTSGNVTAWVSEVRLAQVVVSGIAPTYELHLTNSRGEQYTRTYTLKEFAQATANNGVMNALISAVARSPKDVDGQAWDLGDRYIVSVTGVGSFVAEADILPLLRLNKPIINLITSAPTTSVDEVVLEKTDDSIVIGTFDDLMVALSTCKDIASVTFDDVTRNLLIVGRGIMNEDVELRVSERLIKEVIANAPTHANGRDMGTLFRKMKKNPALKVFIFMVKSLDLALFQVIDPGKSVEFIISGGKRTATFTNNIQPDKYHLTVIE